MQFLVLEGIYGTSLHYLPSCSQINQRKHFNYFSRDYCNACLFGNDPTNADIVNRTQTTFLLDSLASYWNTFIPYRQIPPITAIKEKCNKLLRGILKSLDKLNFTPLCEVKLSERSCTALN